MTQADIAAHLGVSKAAVSFALRGKPGVSATEAARIRKAAAALGYVPHPLVGIHMSQVRSSSVPRYQATLAWIDNHPLRLDPLKPPEFHERRQGAVDEAARLGFRLEEFRPVAREVTPAALGKVLRARGIFGLVLAPQPHPDGVMELEWEHFSAVSLGYSLRSPALHVVSNDQRRTYQHTLDHLRGFGYRRIGTIINEANNTRVNRAWTAAFWDDWHRWPPSRRVKPFFFNTEVHPIAPEAFAGFDDWYRREKPDAIVTDDAHVIVGDRLRSLGEKPGRDVALAVTAANAAAPGYAGMNQNHRAVGAAAVAQLAGMLHRNERGVPPAPQQILLQGFWQSGPSVDERGPAALRSRRARGC